MAHVGCSCDHSSGEADGDSLLPYIDTEHVTCLNERVGGSARHVLRPLAQRADRGCFVDSPAGDPLLVFKIPFTGAVRISSICVCAGPDGRSPAAVKLFVNREEMDVTDAVEGTPAQQLVTPEDFEAALFHPLKPAKFGSVFHLTVAMPGETHGADSLCVYYIGLKGSHTGVVRRVVDAVYESRPVPEGHAVGASAAVGRSGM